MQSLLIAIQFLTRLPVQVGGDFSPMVVGRSLAWYPLVGLLIGVILTAAAWLLQGQQPLLAAALVLTLWVGLSGALHLDGLADTADAWVGGQGDRERTLAIMKDPSSGPIGVTVLVLLLLLKFAALFSFFAEGYLYALLILPALARSAVALLFITTPYVRVGGLGEALSQHAPRGPVAGGLLAVSLLMAVTLGMGAVAVLAFSALLWLALRTVALRRLGGFTGDIAGAVLELMELVALLIAVLVGPHI